MKTWRYIILISTLTPLIRAGAEDVVNTGDWIAWAYSDHNGVDRIKVWANGHSEIVLTRRTTSAKLMPGWTVTSLGKDFSRYTKANPLSEADAKKKFRDAVAAGIEQLKAISPDRRARDTNQIVVEVNLSGKEVVIRQNVISELRAGSQKSQKSDDVNVKRLLALQRIFATFDTEFFQKTN